MANKLLQKVLDELILGDTWIEDKKRNVEELGTCITKDLSIYQTSDGNYRFVKANEENNTYDEYVLSSEQMTSFIDSIIDTLDYLCNGVVMLRPLLEALIKTESDDDL